MWNGTWIVVDSPLPRYTAAKSKSSLKRSLRGSQVPKSFSLSLSLYSRAYPTIEHVSSVLQRGNQPCKINRFETLGPDAGEEVPRMWLHPFNFFKWNWREENSQIGSRWMGNRGSFAVFPRKLDVSRRRTWPRKTNRERSLFASPCFVQPPPPPRPFPLPTFTFDEESWRMKKTKAKK